MAWALNFYGISTFHGTNAEAFKLLGISPEFIFMAKKWYTTFSIHNIYIYTHTVYTPNVNHGLFFLPFDILGVIFLIDYRNSQFCGMFTLIFEDLIINLYQVSIYPLVIWSNNIKHGNGKSTERWIPIKTVGFPSHDLSNSDPRNVYKLIRPERGQVDMRELDPPNFGS